MSDKKQKRFEEIFENGLAFWTSEDGTMLSIVIIRRADWKEIIRREFAYIFQKETFDETQAKETFVKAEWSGSDFFDGNSGQKRGKVWTICPDETPYPVINYELKIPR